MRERTTLLVLACVQFTCSVDFLVMMPLGPHLTRDFGIDDTRFGLLVSAYTFAAAASGVLCSPMVDRFDRRRVLLVVYAAFILATAACGMASGFASMMAARLVAGAFGGILGPLVQTISGDAVAPERRGHAVGTILAAFSVANIVGLPLSLWIAAASNWHMSFYAVVGVSATTALFAWLRLPSMSRHLREPAAGISSPLAPLRRVLGDTRNRRAFALTVVMTAATFTVVPYMTIYLTANVRVPEALLSTVFMLGGIATFLASRLAGVLTDRVGAVPTFRALIAASCVAMLALTTLTPHPLILVLLVTSAHLALVSARWVPAMALLLSTPPPELRGAFMSVNNSLHCLAIGVASIAGGVLISRGPDGLVHGYGWCGLASAALSMATLWWAARLDSKPRSPAQDASLSCELPDA